MQRIVSCGPFAELHRNSPWMIFFIRGLRCQIARVLSEGGVGHARRVAVLDGPPRREHGAQLHSLQGPRALDGPQHGRQGARRSLWRTRSACQAEAPWQIRWWQDADATYLTPCASETEVSCAHFTKSRVGTSSHYKTQS